ncbi:MAG: tRNA dihydrouridine(20/20a) synthase DusA [Alphaproteobacteria bacterium]|nr:tRNA dihydrouridine(20/20a) synthase DusA [Alphaproteobacteria bacterium]
MQQLSPMSHRFCVAPMMDWTDTHCRVLHRALSRKARLYTEMVTAEAVIHGDRRRLIGFDASEHPVAVQLGGSDPVRLAEAARIAAEFGYDEINLNVGCPSGRVQSASFGACLMRTPGRVAECAHAMQSAVSVPVTIKCRLGVDEQIPEEALFALVDSSRQAGVKTFIVHARKAWLSGLSPKDNRSVPPLDYDIVHRLKRAFPELEIVLNGGIEDLDAAAVQLERFDGVMIGRAAYRSPALLLEVDEKFFDSKPVDFDEAMDIWLAYVGKKLPAGVPLASMTRHMLGLFNGRPGARRFRRYLSENANAPGASLTTLRHALAFVYPATTAASQAA